MKIFALVASALVACGYSADFRDCTIICVTAGCPDGLTCGPEGLCRAEESEVCVLPSDGTGGTITHVGGRTIHTFSTSQSGSIFTPPTTTSVVEALIVGGGGGGGSTRGGGGGGAGGLLYLPSFDLTQFPPNAQIVVTVGFGGAPATNGGNSSFGTFLAIGGGAGRPSAMPDGGSGGGAGHDTNAGPAGVGTAGQGNRGGLIGFNSGTTTFTGAGGGGAGSQGGVGVPSAGGAGGPGRAFAISGEQVHYGGGGGGGGQDLGSNGLSPGSGGLGGGGDGGRNAIGEDGVDGTGGGGGGGGGGPDPNFFNGGRGGAGIVIISYPTRLR